MLRAQRTWGGALRPLAGVFRALEPLYPAMKRYRVVGALPTYLPRFYQALLPRDEGCGAFCRSMAWSSATPCAISSTARNSKRRRLQRAHLCRDRRAFLRGNPDDTAQALVINTWLTGNALLNCDKVTMAYSLEARVPFFDPALLDFAAAVPPEIRMKRNKYVLREAMRPLLPDFALERPKKGFETPILGWFAHELRAGSKNGCSTKMLIFGGCSNSPPWKALLRDHFSGRAPQVEVVFRLLTLEMWAQRFLKTAPQTAAVGTE